MKYKTVAAAAAAGGVAALAWYYASLAPETGEADVVTVTTDDGWRLTMRHYPAEGASKGAVVAGHGFAGTALIWDLTPTYSMARHLARCGYDFYALDLRGRADSWPASGERRDVAWSFDDFVFHDLPAAIDTVRNRCGDRPVFWMGLEMSGQAIYAATISGTVEVNGAITLGSPVWTPPEAMVPGVTSAPQARRNGRVLFRIGAQPVGPILALLRSSQLESSFVPANVDHRVPARYLRHGIPDESTRLADQFRDWVDHDTMRSLDHETVWSDRLDEMTIPVMAWAAARDLQRPPEAVRRTFDALGSNDKTLVEAGTAHGFAVDYGHDDLVAATASPTDVFPRIVDWLDDRR